MIDDSEEITYNYRKNDMNKNEGPEDERALIANSNKIASNKLSGTKEITLQNFKDYNESPGGYNQNSTVIDQLIDSMGMSNYLIKILIFSLLNCFSDGSEMVVVSLIMRKLETKWNLTKIKKALIGGSIFGGFLVGALVSGKIMDIKGRKPTLILGSFIFLIFGLFSAWATEFYSFMFFRIGVGLGIGFVIPTTQTFITEVSPRSMRGFNSIIVWLGFPLGEMYVCYVSNLLPLDDQTYHQDNWQLIMILAALPIFFNIIMLIFIMESPRYFLSKNKFEEAFEILEKMKRQTNNYPSTQQVSYSVSVLPETRISSQSKDTFESPQGTYQNKLGEINNFSELDEKIKSELKIYYIQKKTQFENIGYLSTLDPNYKWISIRLWVLWFTVSYIFYGVLYLIPELIGKQKDNINFSDLIQAVAFSTFFEIIGIVSSFIIECRSIGRLGAFKISFILCFLLSILCMIKFKGWIIFLHILKGAVQISNRGLYIYTSECYPTEIRGVGLGLGNGFTRLAGLLTPLINEILLAYSSNCCFIGLAIASLISTWISFSFEKETLNSNID